MRLKRKKKLESPGALRSGTSNKYYKMSNTDCMSVIELPRVGCLLPTLIIEMVERECVGCGERKSNGIEEDDEWICEDCDLLICSCCDQRVTESGSGNMVNLGCCSNGACDQGVDVLCGECGTWDEEDDVWRCPDCQEEHENQKHDKQPPACQTCKKPCWSDDDEVQFVIHGCAVCKECFDEHEEEHALEEEDDAKSANSSTYGGGCRRICRFCKEECSCWNYNSDHEVVCENCGCGCGCGTVGGCGGS